jgi:cytochrome P450
MRTQIDDIKDKRAKGGESKSPSVTDTSTNATVFDSILDSDLPRHEKETERLWQEAQVICIAGTETTAWALSVITFYLLSDPAVMRSLREELESAIPHPSDRLEIKELEKLQYLVCLL